MYNWYIKLREVSSMNFKKPAECGISSKNIEKFIRSIEDRKLFTHDVLIAKGDNIIFEKYCIIYSKMIKITPVNTNPTNTPAANCAGVCFF